MRAARKSMSSSTRPRTRSRATWIARTLSSFALTLAIGGVAATSAVGCGATPAVRHARNGDFGALGKELDARAAKGDLDDPTVRAVARAILEHDLGRFGGAEGVRRVLALEACAKPLRDPLARVADGTGDVAGAAAWVLVQSDGVAVDAYTDAHRDDRTPLFRAAATRGLIDREEGALRATRAIDDDQHVRRAAVLAAGDAGCASDFPLLLEAARKDPSAIVRVDAVRSLARIAARLDTATPRADLVDRLRDLWTSGDEAIRGAVARAWATPVLLDVGGRRELQAAIGRIEGHATIDAAAALMQAGGDGASVLARFAKQADPSVRAHALRLLDPRKPEHAEILVATMDDDGPGADATLRVVAASALLGAPAHRAKALETLAALAKREDLAGTDAAIALASEKDLRAGPRLFADLRTPSFVRFRAASALVRLGRPGDVRPLLASSDVDVRDGAACAVLSTPPAH